MIDERLTGEIIGAAIEVHSYWGPGLYEKIYERSLCRELELRGIRFRRQIPLPIVYKGEQIGDNLILDVLVEDKVVVENKCVKEILPVHTSQLMTYMRLTKSKVGLLINYHTPLLTKGGIIRRVL